jgi:hypothetical protein
MLENLGAQADIHTASACGESIRGTNYVYSAKKVECLERCIGGTGR